MTPKAAPMLPTASFVLLCRLPLVAVLGTALLLTACGGGGGGSTAATPTAPSYNTDLSNVVPGDNTNLGGVAGLPTASGTNVAAVSIRQLSGSTTLTANSPYVTVTVCAPGGGSCQTIPDVLVDTGSTGLRLFSSALQYTSSTALPPISSGGGTLAACAQFASGYMWGSMRQALVQIGGETTTSAIPIQLMGDTTLPAVPNACTAHGGVDFSSSFAGIANGILGISNFVHDCGSACASAAGNGQYFTCSGSSCTGATAALAEQGINPIAAFVSDNNGSILVLPGVPLPGGAASASGSLIFGINTQANNTLSASVPLYPLDTSGNLSMTLNGAAQSGFVDSGSNGYYLALSGVPTCSSPATGFYCPAQAFSLSVGLQQADKSYGPVQNMVIGNALSMFQTQNTALPALGGTAAIGGYIDLGLPFFYGRSIATGLEDPNGSAPNGYLAY